MSILMEILFFQFLKVKYLMTHVRYVLLKENKNLSNLYVDIKYVQNALKNFKNKINIKYVQFADNTFGMK